MSALCVGLDIGSSVCAAVVMEKDTGTVVNQRKFDTSERELITFARGLPRDSEIHMEASELTEWVRTILIPHVKRVRVSHPKSNARIAKDERKNDIRDAYHLARILRSDDVHEVYYPSDQDRTEFKRTVQHHGQLTRHEALLKRRIKAELRRRGVIARGSHPFSKAGRGEMVASLSSGTPRETLENLYDLLEASLKAQKNARQLMLSMAQRYPEIARLMEVPGIGPILACRFVAYIVTPHRFSNKRKLWRYCRLGVAWRASNDQPLTRQCLDWNGVGALKDVSRKAFMVAVGSRRDNAFKRAYHQSLEHTHNTVHARLTIQRKILATLWALWKKEESYRDDFIKG